jgi:hypothetical protein
MIELLMNFNDRLLRLYDIATYAVRAAMVW